MGGVEFVSCFSFDIMDLKQLLADVVRRSVRSFEWSLGHQSSV